MWMGQVCFWLISVPRHIERQSNMSQEQTCPRFHIKENTTVKSTCASCWFRNYAERKPNSVLARIWRWHTGWCPGWKAYKKELAESGSTKTS